jgi:hypothetical protein
VKTVSLQRLVPLRRRWIAAHSIYGVFLFSFHYLHRFIADGICNTLQAGYMKAK